MITPEMLARSGTEHGEQAALFCWAGMPEQKRRYPVLEWMHAIPNSGARGNKVAASNLKAEGVKAGVADIFLPAIAQVGSNFFCGLYIEMKRATGVPSDITGDQMEFAKFVNRQSYCWYCAFGWREAVHIIECYLNRMQPVLTPNQQKVFNNLYG